MRRRRRRRHRRVVAELGGLAGAAAAAAADAAAAASSAAGAGLGVALLGLARPRLGLAVRRRHGVAASLSHCTDHRRNRLINQTRQSRREPIRLHSIAMTKQQIPTRFKEEYNVVELNSKSQ